LFKGKASPLAVCGIIINGVVEVDSELSIISLKPVGIVKNDIKQPQTQGWERIVSHIMVDRSLSEALDNLDEFSHIIVLYWIHQHPPGEPPTKVHPKGDRGIPLKGVFATRSPNRPNPVGKATARLLQRWGNTLLVEGLDAIDGTPVIDIKPYIPKCDSATNARVPQWITEE
jgi:tRNA-Thr(GGU) m(6)t(6)A37 methyltransferase TsaA